MRKYSLDIIDTNKSLCQIMLKKQQIFSQNILFCNNLFHKTCENIEKRNKTIIIRDIFLFICFFAQVLRIYNTKYLNYLYKSVNENRNNAISFYSTCLQLDYFVRFEYCAFIKEQLEKLVLFVDKIEFKILNLIYNYNTNILFFLYSIAR